MLKYTFSRCKYETPDIHPHVLICALYDIHGCPSNEYLGVLTHGPMYLYQDICISIYIYIPVHIDIYLSISYALNWARPKNISPGGVKSVEGRGM